MRRRYVAALSVFVPVVIAAAVHYVYPSTWEWLSGYMLIIALMFKHALLSFWAASKLKILTFLKGLTFLQGIYLLIKRWFLDNVFARWLKRNVTDHIRSGTKEFAHFYRRLDLRKKLRDFFLPTLIGIGAISLIYWAGYLDKILLFTEIKVLVISLSKTLLLIASKFVGFLLDSWITPILEVFALSWVFTWLERTLGPNNNIVRALNALGRGLNRMLFFWSDLNRRYLDPLLNRHISRKTREVNSALRRYVASKKTAYEYEQFDQLERTILDGHIDAYHRFPDMINIADKSHLYSRINAATQDGMEIVAYLSRNAQGQLIPEAVPDSYYHDAFVLEGFASSQKHGVRRHQKNDPDHTDFWILNTSAFALTIGTHSGIVPSMTLLPHSVSLIKTDKSIDYGAHDLYGEFDERREVFVGLLGE